MWQMKKGDTFYQASFSLSFNDEYFLLKPLKNENSTAINIFYKHRNVQSTVFVHDTTPHKGYCNTTQNYKSEVYLNIKEKYRILPA